MTPQPRVILSEDEYRLLIDQRDELQRRNRILEQRLSQLLDGEEPTAQFFYNTISALYADPPVGDDGTEGRR